MHTNPASLRSRFTLWAPLGLLVGGVLTAGLASFAGAQGGTALPDRIYSTGPLTLHVGEHVRFGYILPYIEQPKSAAQFLLTDSAGGRIIAIVDPSFPGSQFRASFFDVFFELNANQEGHFIVKDSNGNRIGDAPTPDGILTGLLVPAVQKRGQTKSPIGTSVQIFDANGGTKTHSFFDVFFDVF